MSTQVWGPLALLWPAHGAAGLLLAGGLYVVGAGALAAVLCRAARRGDDAVAAALAAGEIERTAIEDRETEVTAPDRTARLTRRPAAVAVAPGGRPARRR